MDRVQSLIGSWAVAVARENSDADPSRIRSYTHWRWERRWELTFGDTEPVHTAMAMAIAATDLIGTRATPPAPIEGERDESGRVFSCVAPAWDGSQFQGGLRGFAHALFENRFSPVSAARSVAGLLELCYVTSHVQYSATSWYAAKKAAAEARKQLREDFRAFLLRGAPDADVPDLFPNDQD